MPRLTDTFRAKLGIGQDDPFAPLLDSMDEQQDQVLELGKRATSEAVNAARSVVIPGLAKQLWGVALCSAILTSAIVGSISAYFQSSDYTARVAQIEAQLNERVEKMAEARAEQIAAERLRTCEVSAAAKSSDAQQMLYLAWSAAIPGKNKSVDDARRMLAGLKERDLALLVRLGSQIQRGSVQYSIGVIVKMTPAEQQQLFENFVQSGWTP